MKSLIFIDARTIEAEFSDGVVHLTGEFSGNLNFSLKFNEPVPTKVVLKNLRLQLQGKKMVEVVGYQESSNGLDVTLDSGLRPPGEDIPLNDVPNEAAVLWLGQSKDHPVGFVKLKAIP